MFKDRGATRKRAARHTAGYAVPLLTPGEPTRAPDVLLFVLREAEVDATVARVEPALGDRLGAGEEVHALDAVRVAVTEEGGLPAAEGVVGHGDRDRHVDACLLYTSRCV